jgi:hypothetical protein
VTATSGTSASQSAVSVTSGNTTTVNLNITVPMGTIKTIVKINGAVVPGAAVTITGGPYPITRPAPATDATGTSLLSVPSGAGYTVTVVSYGQTVATTSVTVTTGGTVTVNVAMPFGALKVTAKRKAPGCVVDPSATVSLTGPGGYTAGPFTTSALGVYTFNNLPVGSGYTITATYTTFTGTKVATVVVGSTNVTVSTPTTDNCP